PAGKVTGIDLAPGMVEATRRDVSARGLTNVELHVMDAGAPELPEASFDVVASSFVIFFMPEPTAALSAWRKLLVPGGRLGISTFGKRDPRWEWVDEVFRPYEPADLRDARSGGAGGPFSTDEGVVRLMTAAGFTGVRTTGLDF